MRKRVRNKIKIAVALTAKIPGGLSFFVPIVYITIVSAYMLWHRAWFSPDQFFAFAVVATLVLGRTKEFLRDWIPVLILLFSYEYLRGIVPALTDRAHIYPLIRADNFLFGFIPTIKIQNELFHTSHLHWYDYVAVILYISHFIIPMFVAFIFWLRDRTHFKAYTASFLVLSYMAFITFIIFPAMPPWMASNNGYLPPLQKIMDQVMGSFAHPISVPTVYQFFGANLVAPFPSLHAAYPWLIFLFVYNKSKKISLLVLPYVFGVWFAVVYLGEHYVVDVLAGITYATGAYWLVQRYHNFMRSRSLETIPSEVSDNT